jgi:hypothetical protein
MNFQLAPRTARQKAREADGVAGEAGGLVIIDDDEESDRWGGTSKREQPGVAAVEAEFPELSERVLELAGKPPCL